ncbi:hypothetical protein L6452_24892 [Arctium lappa]|uniref:Uncharacterized protein n=1 Tax=Arctium lappa TaxID=4217 RepID=A0ACB9AA50_ARCLA|nr:hypothetical protein L6452_24892 [Arctium lappa]
MVILPRNIDIHLKAEDGSSLCRACITVTLKFIEKQDPDPKFIIVYQNHIRVLREIETRFEFVEKSKEERSRAPSSFGSIFHRFDLG